MKAGRFQSLVLSAVRTFSKGKPPKMNPFSPQDHGLPHDFVLTNYTKMKG